MPDVRVFVGVVCRCDRTDDRHCRYTSDETVRLAIPGGNNLGSQQGPVCGTARNLGDVGILSAVFLAESDRNNRLANFVRLLAKILTGFPSILAGVFAYGAIVLATGGFWAIAGAVAVSILMLPTIMLTAEDAVRMVPGKMKEAAIGIGATKTQTVWMIMLPTALQGILTGVMLAVARGAGETAPLIFTALRAETAFPPRKWGIP